MASTSLTIAKDGFVFKDNLPIFRILDTDWIGPIEEKISMIFVQHGDDVALQLLDTFVDLLVGKIRKINDLDALEVSNKTKIEIYGIKHTCSSCKKKFYDMNRFLKCAFCGTLLNMPAVDSSSI